MFEDIVDAITKADYKKTKRDREKRQRKHTKLSPKQRQALKKAQRKSIQLRHNVKNKKLKNNVQGEVYTHPLAK